MRESRPIMTSPTAGSEHGRYRLAWWTLVFALICGGILRSIWIEDIEWKVDERWSYRMSQEVGRTRPWPWLGMPTSLGFPNPGLSAWIFVPIARVSRSPTSMARVVVLVNMIGLIGFAAAVPAFLPIREREPWIWGLALQAVSPYAIRLSRKIWPPSLLTPLLLLVWIGHRHRDSRRGAFLWGLAGALIGQVHLSGWFVAMGLVIGTFIAECRGRLPRSRTWRFWLLGTVLGLLTAIPWALALQKPPVNLPPETLDFLVVHRVMAYLYGVTAAGLSVLPFIALGLGQDTLDFENGPIVLGIRTCAPAWIRLFIVLVVIARIVVRLFDAIARPGFRWALRSICAGRALAQDC